MEEEIDTVKATGPDMSRFWLTFDQAVNIVLLALDPITPTGAVLIPKCSATTMKSLAEYVIKKA